MNNRQREWIGFFVWLFLPFTAAWIGSQFEPGEWYLLLEKPAWTPPNWVFAPVWTFLFASMGFAAWLVWREGGFSRNTIALSVFLTQLALNAAWSWIFFGLNRIELALVEILFLDLAILLLIVLFLRRNTVAGVLLLPYCAWVTFAAFLNYALWSLNR